MVSHRKKFKSQNTDNALFFPPSDSPAPATAAPRRRRSPGPSSASAAAAARGPLPRRAALGPAELETSNPVWRPTRVPGGYRVAQESAKHLKTQKQPKPGNKAPAARAHNLGPLPGGSISQIQVPSPNENAQQSKPISRSSATDHSGNVASVRTECRRRGKGGEEQKALWFQLLQGVSQSPPGDQIPSAANRRPLRTTRSSLSAAPAPPASRPSSPPPGPCPRPGRRAAPRGPRRRRRGPAGG